MPGNHLEARIVHRVAVAVAGVDIRGGQVADDGPGCIFSHAKIVEGDGRWDFVDIVEVDGNRSRVAASSGVGDSDREIEGWRGLKIELAAVGHGEFSRHRVRSKAPLVLPAVMV